ncbi:MarR family winged helix-turn-helix transcriptional regulator [Streptomyces sp. 900105755]|uniref:MarR family winged helix-turn-helix transcriptional regulator n=1 Tax=Streptomyces sp. Ag109_O5-10 TaxID=1855349 RepID=UPI0008950CED|nr:MarR family transcriptional regulator [Streptomyces sp. Ag109_O5-10]SEE05875.1 DNA-binding transcriptional regulator, MarR family [Streptomyces sp. Ag109_O5-10]
MRDDQDTPQPEPVLPPPLLDDHLCFSLYAASRAITGAYRPLLDPLGLTYPQYLTLVALGEHGAMTVKDLVATLQLDYGTVTPLIKRLETNGLLARTRRTDDERVVEVALTPQGSAMHRHIASIPPVIGDAIGLTPAEITHTQDLVRRLTANLHRHTTGTSPAGTP